VKIKGIWLKVVNNKEKDRKIKENW